MTECIHGQEFESCSFGCTFKKEELAIRAAKLFKDLFPELRVCVRVSEHQVSGLPRCKGDNDCPNRWSKTPVPTSCPHPAPIDINWDNAMRLRDEIIKKLGWGVWEYNLRMQRRRQPCPDRPEYTPDTPADYILAACVTKEAENEAM